MSAAGNEHSTARLEHRKLVPAFCGGLSTAGTDVAGRSAADALFLPRVEPAWLPLTYLLAACSVGPPAFLLLHLAADQSLKQVILLTLLWLSASSIALCQIVQEFNDAMVVLVGISLLAEIRGCLNTFQYGILLNALFAGGPVHHRAPADSVPQPRWRVQRWARSWASNLIRLVQNRRPRIRLGHLAGR